MGEPTWTGRERMIVDLAMFLELNWTPITAEMLYSKYGLDYRRGYGSNLHVCDMEEDVMSVSWTENVAGVTHHLFTIYHWMDDGILTRTYRISGQEQIELS